MSFFLQGTSSSNETTIAEIDSVLDQFSPGLNTYAPASSSRDDGVHDDYFYIRRVNSTNPSETFLHAVVLANAILLRDTAESSFTISAHKLDLLNQGFPALLSWMLGVPKPTFAGMDSGFRQAERWVSASANYHSMKRWIRGHQIFAALTQGLIVAFTELKLAIQRADAQAIESSAVLCVTLLRSSAAALEFTGDFPSRDYSEIVRPSMTPPLVPDTFSGLLSTDHRCFVQLMREMKPLLDSLYASHPESHKSIAEAVAGVYASHQFVCDRFVGRSPSLMMASGSTKSGAEQIEKFKHLRLKAFDASKKGAKHVPTSAKR